MEKREALERVKFGASACMCVCVCAPCVFYRRVSVATRGLAAASIVFHAYPSPAPFIALWFPFVLREGVLTELCTIFF